MECLMRSLSLRSVFGRFVRFKPRKNYETWLVIQQNNTELGTGGECGDLGSGGGDD